MNHWDTYLKPRESPFSQQSHHCSKYFLSFLLVSSLNHILSYTCTHTLSHNLPLFHSSPVFSRSDINLVLIRLINSLWSPNLALSDFSKHWGRLDHTNILQARQSPRRWNSRKGFQEKQHHGDGVVKKTAATIYETPTHMPGTGLKCLPCRTTRPSFTYETHTFNPILQTQDLCKTTLQREEQRFKSRTAWILTHFYVSVLSQVFYWLCLGC